MERFLGALSLTLLLTGLAAVAQVQTPSNPVDQVMRSGLMTPAANGELQPDAVLSRAELAQILVKVFRLDQQPSRLAATIQLQDVPPSHWAYRDIQLVLQNRIMEGYREGRFYPDQRVTRAEAFSIFAQAYGIFQFADQTVNEILKPYPDAPNIPKWAKKPMATAVFEGFVNLRNGNKIDPLSPMTRGDMLYALSRYLYQQQIPSGSQWKPQLPLGS